MFSIFSFINKKGKKTKSYKVPFTEQAAELFKVKLLKQSPEDARASLKTLFQECNNGTIHPKWGYNIGTDDDILFHVAIPNTPEEITAMLFTLINERLRKQQTKG